MLDTMRACCCRRSESSQLAVLHLPSMLALRKTPTQHGAEAAGCFAGFSLLTEGDVLRKLSDSIMRLTIGAP